MNKNDANTDEEGLVLEYLSNLTLFNNHFVYDDVSTSYTDIIGIQYTATATKHSINFIPTGTTYSTNLYLFLSNGSDLNIDQESSVLRSRQKEKAEAIMRAASIFHEITFTQRMEKYEKQLHEKGFVSWGKYQIHKNGDLFKKHVFLFNLKSEGVSNYINYFTFETAQKSKNIKQSLSKLWKGNETIDISIDKDCFLYFMKHYIGLSWANETVRSKRHGKEELYKAIIILGAKVCKADGRVSSEEIKTFKLYFGIDEKSHPYSSTVFSEAVNSKEGVNEPSRRLYQIFEGNKEPLEHIVIGLMKIAAADGVFTDAERSIIEIICHELKFSSSEISRLFLIFDKAKKSQTQSGNTRSEYLKILGLQHSATYEEIKIAYKELARKHHPDLLFAQGVSTEQIKESEEILKVINVAYKWLCENSPVEQRTVNA